MLAIYAGGSREVPQDTQRAWLGVRDGIRIELGAREPLSCPRVEPGAHLIRRHGRTATACGDEDRARAATGHGAAAPATAGALIATRP